MNFTKHLCVFEENIAHNIVCGFEFCAAKLRSDELIKVLCLSLISSFVSVKTGSDIQTETPPLPHGAVPLCVSLWTHAEIQKFLLSFVGTSSRPEVTVRLVAQSVIVY